MSVDMYVRMDGIDGECREEKHTKWMQVEHVSFGVRQNATFRVSNAGNQSAGTADFAPITVRMSLDTAYPNLSKYCWLGKHIDSVQIDFVRAGGDKQIFLTYEFKNAMITSVNLIGDSGGDDTVANVEYQFVFSEIVNTYFPTTNAGGGTEGSLASGYDLAKRTEV